MHHEESLVLIRRLRLMSSSAASCPLTIYDPFDLAQDRFTIEYLRPDASTALRSAQHDKQDGGATLRLRSEPALSWSNGAGRQHTTSNPLIYRHIWQNNFISIG